MAAFAGAASARALIFNAPASTRNYVTRWTGKLIGIMRQIGEAFDNVCRQPRPV